MTNIVKKGALQLMVQREDVQKRFEDVLGENKGAFISSLLSLNSKSLSNCDPQTVLSAAMTAATLKLPINPNLGFAFIIPYESKHSDLPVAQFQMGYKGFIQLAERSAQYKTINATEVYEGDIKSFNRFTGDIDFISGPPTSKKVVGYCSYVRMINGFEKFLYMTNEQLIAHANKYSKSFKKGYGLWKDDFETMALKTTIKLLLSKWGVLSVELQKAIEYDQCVMENGNANYIDSESNMIDISDKSSVMDGGSEESPFEQPTPSEEKEKPKKRRTRKTTEKSAPKEKNEEPPTNEPSNDLDEKPKEQKDEKPVYFVESGMSGENILEKITKNETLKGVIRDIGIDICLDYMLESGIRTSGAVVPDNVANRILVAADEFKIRVHKYAEVVNKNAVKKNTSSRKITTDNTLNAFFDTIGYQDVITYCDARLMLDDKGKLKPDEENRILQDRQGFVDAVKKHSNGGQQ